MRQGDPNQTPDELRDEIRRRERAAVEDLLVELAAEGCVEIAIGEDGRALYRPIREDA